MKFNFLRKYRMDNVTQAHWNLVGVFNEHHEHILDLLNDINVLLSDYEFDKTLAKLKVFYIYTNYIEEYMKVYYNKNYLRFVESEARISHDVDSIKEKEEYVLKWLRKMDHLCDELICILKQRNKIGDFNDISNVFVEFNDVCTNMKPLIELTNALKTCVMEYRMYEKSELITNDKLKRLYNDIKLHPDIRKTCKNLFLKGEYESSIFEAFKMVEKRVQNKSKLNQLYGKNLMMQVFSENNPTLLIQDPDPIQQKNKQEGLRFLLSGSISLMKNPLSHRLTEKIDPFIALQYIAFASALLYNVDLCVRSQ